MCTLWSSLSTLVKACDTVRHSTLVEKLAQLHIPDQIHNWLANFFTGHSHRMQYLGQQLTTQMINANIIQGSAIGPASYVVTASDLNLVTPSNEMCKFADDTYLIVSACNIDCHMSETENTEVWARKNNLTLNWKKSPEIVFRDYRRKHLVSPPPPTVAIECVTILKVLGVTITNTLSASEHIRDVIKSCAQTQYALRVLRAHGLSDCGLHTVFRSVVVAKIMYACSAYRHDEQWIDTFLWQNKKCWLCRPDLPPFQELCEAIDELLTEFYLTNNISATYFLLRLLPQSYNLWRRLHSQLLPQHQGHLTESNFTISML